jgi:hypothetical protein
MGKEPPPPHIDIYVVPPDSDAETPIAPTPEVIPAPTPSNPEGGDAVKQEGEDNA